MFLITLIRDGGYVPVKWFKTQSEAEQFAAVTTPCTTGSYLLDWPEYAAVAKALAHCAEEDCPGVAGNGWAITEFGPDNEVVAESRIFESTGWVEGQYQSIL